MTQYSANLGFLWQSLSLPDGIRAAKEAGFVAVECHWPYDEDIDEVTQALMETGLPMLGLNTSRGNVAAGENGLSALVGREHDAKATIDKAIDYAVHWSVPNIHVMAGFANGEQAEATFLENLRYACDQASLHLITILIEPLNHHDAPGYFLQTSAQAADIIAKVDRPNIKLMFDFYHLQIMEGDVCRHFESLLPIIGHVQIASVPDRAEPDSGELNYRYILDRLKKMGYTQPIGAEYKPSSDTIECDWMKALI
ncbi:hydroxypyruvate isomerase family protein [Marinomonas sp. 2405UD68-3]|uniref:hydroxypyruvate isomerase family protein n=1 Tax=Marinomonas sp. 2405UD68-3 TaxID=3391835 RepID=UPI0039C986E8